MRWVIVLGSLLWFPHSLERIQRLGYDFPIYLDGPSNQYWLYQDWLTIVFEPFRHLPLTLSFGIFYALCVWAWVGIIQKIPRGLPRVILGALSFYPCLLVLEVGNLTLILAWLCLSPWGVVLATLVKPYLAGFMVIHAIRKSYDVLKRT